MSTHLRRLTFAVPPDMEWVIDEAKRMYYDKTQSEMIRTLIVAGLASVKSEKGTSLEQETEYGPSDGTDVPFSASN